MTSFTTYNFPDHESGTTFPGLQFTLTVNAIYKTPTEIVMDVAGKLFTLSGGNFIVNGAGQFQLKEQIINLPDGVHNYRITLTIDGKKKTYIKGTWTIL
jgi:hypothetical protein